MKFTIDGFAQRNILKYKDDDTVKGNYSGEITCLISSLEKSREMAELKFAGCDMRGITAFIRLYKYDGEGKAELQKVQPRILRGKQWRSIKWNLHTIVVHRYHKKILHKLSKCSVYSQNH